MYERNNIMYYLIVNNKKLKIKNNKYATLKEANIERIYHQPDYEEKITIKRKVK